MILALALVLQTSSDSLATRVRQLADSYLTAYFEQHPDEATLDGVANARHDRLPDNSPATLARWQEREDAWLAALERINPERLTGRPEWVAYGIMRDAIEGSAATRVCRVELWSVAHTGGGWLSTVTSLAALQPVGSDDARRQTLARWRAVPAYVAAEIDRKSTRLNSSHQIISYAVFCLKKKKKKSTRRFHQKNQRLHVHHNRNFLSSTVIVSDY